MHKEKLLQFQQALSKQHETLREWMATESNNDIPLGGADVKAVLQVVSELKDTLERINNGTFGLCQKCEGEVETERLELDYTTCVCLFHYSEAQIRALESDLELAVKVQKQLLPCAPPSLSNMQIAVHADSARIFSGDYYDFFKTKNGGQGLVLADVMGKGLPASILMSNLQASVRILGQEYENPDDLLARLNGLFRNNLRLIKFISIFLAKFDLKANVLEYCNAGHHPAIRWDANLESINWLNPTGPAIGLTKSAEFRTETLPFNPGDVVVFYTDGLVEMRNSANDEFSEKRLEDIVRKYNDENADEILGRLLISAKNFTSEFHDDVTVLVVKIL